MIMMVNTNNLVSITDAMFIRGGNDPEDKK